MRPLAAIVLTFLLFISLFGFYISFSIQRSVIRKQVARYEKFEKGKEISRLVFTLEEYNTLRKFDGGKEFSWQGNMYDVIDRKIEGNKIIVTAYLDHKETSLIDRFLSVFRGESRESEDSRTFNNLPEFVSFIENIVFYTLESVFSFPRFKERTLSAFTATLTPPPDLAV